MLGAAAQADATALSNASGTFYYTDLLAGQEQIVHPVIGQCYSTGIISSTALSASNQTDAVATTYTDPFCTLLGTHIDPGNSSAIPFGSVRFSAA
jgi:hypothetical protein